MIVAALIRNIIDNRNNKATAWDITEKDTLSLVECKRSVNVGQWQKWELLVKRITEWCEGCENSILCETLGICSVCIMPVHVHSTAQAVEFTNLTRRIGV